MSFSIKSIPLLIEYLATGTNQALNLYKYSTTVTFQDDDKVSPESINCISIIFLAHLKTIKFNIFIFSVSNYSDIQHF